MASPLLAHPLPPGSPCDLPPLLSSPCCSVHMRATFWRLSIWAFCGATPAKSSLAYLCAPGLLFVLPPSPFTSLSVSSSSWVFYYANDKIFINVININFGNNSRLWKIMRNDRGDKRLGALPLSTFRQCQKHSGESILIVCEAPIPTSTPAPTTASTPSGNLRSA